MDILLLFYLGLVWLLGGLLTGVTSFGGNLFAIPMLTLAMPVREAILVGCLSGTSMIVAVTFLYRRRIPWKEAICIGLATLPGAPLGVAFLQYAGPRLLLLAAGGSLLLFLLWHALSGRLKGAEKPLSRWWLLPQGVAAGIMMGAVGMGGPPVVLYAYLRHWGKEASIGGINAACGVTMLGVLTGQWEAGMYTAPVLQGSLVGAMGSAAGILASLPLVRRIDARLFRRLLLVMLALSALMLLLRGFLA